MFSKTSSYSQLCVNSWLLSINWNSRRYSSGYTWPVSMSSCMPISDSNLLPLSGDQRLQKIEREIKGQIAGRHYKTAAVWMHFVCLSSLIRAVLWFNMCNVLAAGLSRELCVCITYLSLSMSLTFLFAKHCLTIISRVEALEVVRPAENRSARGRRRTRHRLSLGSWERGGENGGEWYFKSAIPINFKFLIVNLLSSSPYSSCWEYSV